MSYNSYSISFGHYHNQILYPYPSIYQQNYRSSRTFIGDINLDYGLHELQVWDFDGLTGPNSFFDWLESLENFFEFHNINDSCYLYRINMELVRSASVIGSHFRIVLIA